MRATAARGSSTTILRVIVVNDDRTDLDIVRDALRALRELRKVRRGFGSSTVPKRETD